MILSNLLKYFNNYQLLQFIQYQAIEKVLSTRKEDIGFIYT